MAVYKRGEVWWFKFTWNGQQIRESTKQGNKRIAEQIESARKTGLAKGEVGIRDRVPVPSLRDFAERDFLPFVESQFKDKPNTLAYYTFGVRMLLAFKLLANSGLDTISGEKITAFITMKREAGLQVSSINRQLEVLRRMLKLATEWGKLDKVLPKVSMLPGQRRRERVLSAAEEAKYLEAAGAIGTEILEASIRMLQDNRVVGAAGNSQDPYRLHDVATLLIECALRPEEAYRLRWDEIREGCLHVSHGKTDNARRVIPLPPRAAAVVDMRRKAGTSEWVFPAPTRSGHIEQSSVKKRHKRACMLANIAHFPPYTLRHTCLTRWAAVMDPYTLAYLAGHSDFATTRLYVHPRTETVLDAMERAEKANRGHKIGHTGSDITPIQMPGRPLTN